MICFVRTLLAVVLTLPLLLSAALRAEVWNALDETLTFSSPIVFNSGGKKQLIVWTQESVTSLDPAAGTTDWRQKLMTSSDYAVSTPVVEMLARSARPCESRKTFAEILRTG